MTLYNRSLSMLQHIDFDLLSGITFQDMESTVQKLNCSRLLFGTSFSNLSTDKADSLLVSTSISNLEFIQNFLQNEIDALVLLGVSAGNVDLLYGISVAVLDSKISLEIGVTNTALNNSMYALSISTSNLSGNKQDKAQCSVSFTNIQTEIDAVNDSLYTDTYNIGNTFTNNNVLVASSFADVASDINYIYNVLQTEIDGKDSENAFTTLEGVVGALDTAYTAFSTAQTIWNTIQGTNNTTQQTEIDTLQGQIDSIDTRKNNLEELLGVFFKVMQSR